MIKYLFVFLWNSRKKFIGILLEQALVFIVLMVCMISLFDMLRQYREPGLLDTENVVLFGFMAPRKMDPAKRREINLALNAGIHNLRQWDYVESVSESHSLVPYLREPEYYASDSVTLFGRKFEAHSKVADRDAQSVFDIRMERGKWLPPLPNGSLPVVITRQLANLIGNTDDELIGAKMLDDRNQIYTITGIVPGIKEDVFTVPQPSIITQLVYTPDDEYRIYREICARVKSGHIEEFCDASYREFKRLVPYFDEIEFIIRDMGIFKEKAMFPVTSRLKLLVIPTLFLLTFAFIGTLGLLMLNVKKRTQEFGIHRAVGAPRRRLMCMMIVQSLILTLVASVPGILLSLFVFSISLTHLAAISATLCIMLLFSLISSYYPAMQITRINTATVLRQE